MADIAVLAAWISNPFGKTTGEVRARFGLILTCGPAGAMPFGSGNSVRAYVPVEISCNEYE